MGHQPIQRTGQVTAVMLQTLEVLQPAPKETLGALAAMSFMRSYSKGNEIDWETREGTEVVFGVLVGAVDLGFRSVEGREQQVLQVPAGQMFWEIGRAQLGGLDQAVAAVLSTPTVLCQFPRGMFIDVVSNCPEAKARVIEQQMVWLDVLGALLADRLHDAPTRVQRMLERNTQQNGEPTAHYTHEAIAAQTGAHRVQVSRVLRTLIKQGAVELDEHHHIARIHPDELRLDE